MLKIWPEKKNSKWLLGFILGNINIHSKLSIILAYMIGVMHVQYKAWSLEHDCVLRKSAGVACRINILYNKKHVNWKKIE